MKYLTQLLSILFLSTLIYACSVSGKTHETVRYFDSKNTEKKASIDIRLTNGKEFNHPTYAIWIEDMEGNYLRSIYVSKSYASGIFGHQMLGDSVWLRTAGKSVQPAALPYWTNKKGMINGKTLIPSPQHPFTDANTGATPLGNLHFSANINQQEAFRILLEVNQPWDWNKFWTNNKYPDSDAYKHSAQPSVVYAVTVNKEHDVYFMNPIGHGDAKGESGKLFTRLNTLSSATQIFDSIEIITNK